MTLLEIFLIGIGLSMDAFAVAICKGLAMPNKVDKRGALLIALYFGVFQAVMPALGWLLGSQFARYVTQMAPWIAFVLLAWIGGNMIRESLSKEEKEDEETGAVSHKELLVLAVATSIDALAVGVTFAFLRVDLLPAAGLIGGTTFCLSALGTAAGSVCGGALRARAAQFGGGLLILLGVRILLDHLGGFSPASLAFFHLI